MKVFINLLFCECETYLGRTDTREGIWDWELRTAPEGDAARLYYIDFGDLEVLLVAENSLLLLLLSEFAVCQSLTLSSLACCGQTGYLPYASH